MLDHVSTKFEHIYLIHMLLLVKRHFINHAYVPLLNIHNQ